MLPVSSAKTSADKAVFALMVFIILLTLAATGYWMLFSNFATYDDEGYILLSAREYFVHGSLYEKVYSQYGPAFYMVSDGFQQSFGAVLNHTSARMLTLGYWLGAALCCSLVVWRHTASRSLSWFTLTATFLYLYFITDEPFHPGSLIFFVLAASLYVITLLFDTQKYTSAVVIAGCTGAFLTLTKINVGIFFIASVSGWALIHRISSQPNRLVRPAVGGIFILLALALMHTLLYESWVQTYLMLFASGSVALIVALDNQPLFTRRHAGWFAFAIIGTALAILAAVWLRGTSLIGLFEGVLIGPLSHPANYSYPVDWRSGSLFVGGISLVLALTYPVISRRFSKNVVDQFIVILRLVQFAALLVGFSLLMNFRAVGAIFSYVAPLLWIWVIPLKGVQQSPHHRLGRELLAVVLLLQYLHAYPVGGSQESWGTFLLMPLAALGLDEIRRWLVVRASSGNQKYSWWPTISTIIVFVLVAKTAAVAFVAHRVYSSQTPLGLAGAEQLHLPPNQRASYRILSLNAVAHTNMLFSLPGMFSFNLWTGLPTPTEKNTTLWLTLLNETEQKKIIQKLENSPRAGLIVQEDLVALMRTNHIPLQGPLWDYIHANFRSAFELEGFALWTRTGRIIAPLNVATLSKRAAPDSSGKLKDTRLEFCLAHEGTPITGLELLNPLYSSAPRLDERNSEIVLTPINSAGQASGPATSTSWPIASKGIIRVQIYFDHASFPLLSSTSILHLSANKNDLGEIIVNQQ